VGTGLTAVYFLLLVNRAFFGRLETRSDGKVVTLPPVAWRERSPAIILALLIVLFGLQPNWLVDWTRATLSEFSTAPAVLARLGTVPESAPLPLSVISKR
jgi:NAD(P)H-quinone oxidoreductase subunit 4